jgi:hypothetical protein
MLFWFLGTRLLLFVTSRSSAAIKCTWLSSVARRACWSTQTRLTTHVALSILTGLGELRRVSSAVLFGPAMVIRKHLVILRLRTALGWLWTRHVMLIRLCTYSLVIDHQLYCQILLTFFGCRNTPLPTIPVQPLSYSDAAPLLRGTVIIIHIRATSKQRI